MIDAYRSLMGTLQRERPILYLAMAHHRNLRGQPMTYRTQPYLVELMMDFPDLDGADIISGVQTGKSEVFILYMLYMTMQLGRVAAYVLPTDGIRNRFVADRIDPLLALVPYYRDRCPGGEPDLAPPTGTNAAHRAKRIGPGMMMFLGAGTAANFVEFSADAIFIDELDQCEPRNIAKAPDRIKASPYPQIFRLGNPTLPGVGIDAAYAETDRRRWYYACPHCGEEQALDWHVHFVRKTETGEWVPRDETRWRAMSRPLPSALYKVLRGDLRPACRSCGEFFERDECWIGWRAENPAAHRRGYHMSRLDVLHQSMAELFQKWCEVQGDRHRLSAFYTSDLGVAFEESGAQVTVEELRACCTGAENDYVGGPEYAEELVVMGVDVGSLLNVTIDAVRPRHVVQDRAGGDGATSPPPATQKSTTRREGVHVGVCATFEDLDDLIDAFHVRVVAIDWQPETRKCQELRDRMLEKGVIVWLVRFSATPRVGLQRFGAKPDWTASMVTVDRTQLMDAAHDDIRNGDRVFPEDCFSVLGWSDQMRAAKRVLDPEKMRMSWSKGVDHYRLCDAYALVAAEMAQQGATYHG